MPSVLSRPVQRGNNNRKNPAANRPQPTVPILIAGATGAGGGSVLTTPVPFDFSRRAGGLARPIAGATLRR